MRYRRTFYREKQIECGPDFLEVDIFLASGTPRRGRGKKQKATAPKQRNLNDKNAKRYFSQLVHANFTEDDYCVHLTYSPQFLPADADEAERVVGNYIDRLRYHCRRRGLPPLKYLLVTEEGAKRIHHHLVLQCALPREEIEGLWRVRRRAGEEKGRRIGYANADSLQFDEDGLTRLCNYLTKDQRTGKKRWSGSHNLTKPVVKPPRDDAYSHRQVRKLATAPEDDLAAYWEKRFKGYKFLGCQRPENKVTGTYSLYLWMKRRR